MRRRYGSFPARLLAWGAFTVIVAAEGAWERLRGTRGKKGADMTQPWPAHATHIWNGQPVYDRSPFPGGPNPIACMMNKHEWDYLEHEARLAHDREQREDQDRFV